MEKPLVNFDMEHMAKAVPAFVRERAKKAGSYVIYMQDDLIIKENPRTGEKTVIGKDDPNNQ